ncbi:hypothetical protein Tco_0347404 [Tanacetum coccineum]
MIYVHSESDIHRSSSPIPLNDDRVEMPYVVEDEVVGLKNSEINNRKWVLRGTDEFGPGIRRNVAAELAGSTSLSSPQ